MTVLDDELKREAGPGTTDIETLVAGRHRDPFSILGPHRTQRGWILRTLQPEATRVELVDRGGIVLAPAGKLPAGGLFDAALDRAPGSYRWRVHWPLGPLAVEDP